MDGPEPELLGSHGKASKGRGTGNKRHNREELKITSISERQRGPCGGKFRHIEKDLDCY